MKYYYGLQDAADHGVKEHPQADILRFFPDATSFRPESLGDCWFFEATPRVGVDLPRWILPCGSDGVPAWDYHEGSST